MKNILLIAGSDSVGGAGVQADIKACENLGCYNMTALTCFVAENTRETYDIGSVPAKTVELQIKALMQEFKIDAVKIGMLFDAEIMRVVGDLLPTIDAPIVLDPVCISKSGVKLIKDDAIAELKKLFKFADVATPNKFEAKELFNNDFSKVDCNLVVKKTVQDNHSVDTLYKTDGSKIEFKTPLADPLIMHGAGCTFSTSIACFLAKGYSLENAILEAKNYVFACINNGLITKFGKTVLNHKVRV